MVFLILTDVIASDLHEHFTQVRRLHGDNDEDVDGDGAHSDEPVDVNIHVETNRYQHNREAEELILKATVPNGWNDREEEQIQIDALDQELLSTAFQKHTS